MWQNIGGTSDNKKFREKSQREQLRDILSKLLSMSGYMHAMRSDTNNDFEEVHKLLKRHQDYLYFIQNRSEIYFYITVIFFLISFGQQQLGEISSFISVFSDQNVWRLF